MTEYKTDYYRVGTRDDIVVSNSSMSAINPDQGGSPEKFIKFFDDCKEEQQSISLERGSLLHLWHEHESAFIISDIEQPSKMMADWCDRIFLAAQPSGIQFHEVGDDIIVNYRNGAYANVVNQTTLLKKFADDGKVYLDFLFRADGKHALTPATKIVLDGSMNSLQNHPKANDILFGDLPTRMDRFKEEEIYWSLPLAGSDRILKQKAKIDNFIVDWDGKKIFLNDLKSTSKPVSLFKNSFTYWHYYRQLAFYGLAIYEWLKQRGEDPTGWVIKPRIVAVDSTPEFNSKVFLIDSRWQEIGQIEYQYLNELIAWHVINNEWKLTVDEKTNNGDSYLDFNKQDEIHLYSNRAVNNREDSNV